MAEDPKAGHSPATTPEPDQAAGGYQPAPGSAQGDPPRSGTALVQARAATMQVAFQGLMPTSIGEAFTLATYLAKSNAIPSSLRGKPESVLTVVLAGMEVGLTPIRAIQSITNISGNLAMRADLQLALARRDRVLAFYDEAFEDKGRTDKNLAVRLKASMKKFDQDDVDLVLAKIAAAVEGMPNGKPYAWAVGQRVGESNIHVRTFTFLDAERAVIYEKDEDNPGQPAAKKPLSEKFNYKSFPGDMYPKRARVRLLQVVASDVTAGLPAVEQIEGGQILDAEVHRVDDAGGHDLEGLLATIEDQNPDWATTIRNGFAQLRMGPAKQLQKLVEFRDHPDQLVNWLKDEWAARQGKDRKRPDVLGDQAHTGVDQGKGPDKSVVTGTVDGQVVTERDVPAGGDAKQTLAQVAADLERYQQQQKKTGPAPATPAAQPIPPVPPVEPERPQDDGPKEPESRKGGKPSVKDLAARFKAGVKF